MLTVIIFVCITIVLIASIFYACSIALHMREPSRHISSRVCVSNNGVHTDERQVHHFIAKGFIK